jgi:hypothetical protein
MMLQRLMMARAARVVLLAVLASSAALAESGTYAEIETFLLNGKVVSTEEIGSGITKPKKVVRELDGQTMRAAYKAASAPIQ